MRYILMLVLSCLPLSYALADVSYDPLLNTVVLQLNAEQWVTSKTAVLTVGVNASVSDMGLEKIQSEVITKLNQISNKGTWHIVSFNRSLDQSGLERVQISAESRLTSSDLVGVREKAKALSKPGETFTIDNVAFTPSDAELRDANTQVRNNIYQQINNEIINLNKLYPDQKFYLHTVSFLGDVAPMPQGSVAMYMQKSTGTINGSGALPVGDKLKITATVTLASAPNADVVKIVHN